MKKILTLLFFILSAQIIARAQTKLIDTIDATNRMLEEYSVLQSDESIKEGKFAEYLPYNTRGLVTSGSYKNNKKDGTWKQYQGGKVLSKGKYKDGKRVGVWTAYDIKGDVIVKYDYTNLKLLEAKRAPSDTSNYFWVVNGAKPVKTKLERGPIFIDGWQTARRNIVTITRYPRKAVKNNVSGVVLIGFTVGTDGKTSDYHVVKSVGSGCDEEALFVIKSISGHWLPGILNGNPVPVEYIWPVSFTLQQ